MGQEKYIDCFDPANLQKLADAINEKLVPALLNQQKPIKPQSKGA